MPISETEVADARLIELRRAKVVELLAKGHQYNSEMGRMLAVSNDTIAKDIQFIKEQSNKTVEEFVNKEIPYHLYLCMNMYDQLMQKCATKLEQIGDSDHRLSLSIIQLMRELIRDKGDLMGSSFIAIQMLEMWRQKEAKLNKMVITAEQPITTNTNSDNNNVEEDELTEEQK